MADWRIFRFKTESVGYCELLNRLDTALGLAVEAVRCFPEVLGTASAAKGSSSLNRRERFTLEQVHESFGPAVARLCGFVGFGGSEVASLLRELGSLDLSRGSSLPDNVTRTASDSAELESVLSQDPLFANLFGQTARDMGFDLPSVSPAQRSSIFPDWLVDTLLAGRSHLLRSWQTSKQLSDFMRVRILWGPQRDGAGSGPPPGWAGREKNRQRGPGRPRLR